MIRANLGLGRFRAGPASGDYMLQPAPPHEALASPPGWRRVRGTPSLAEVFGSVATRPTGSLWRRLLAFLGPGYLVAVGYMAPGNWATSLAGGSKFGYALLTVALLSNLMAIILQALCARLGIGAGRDLAQACRDAFPRPLALPLWVLAEIAICATDLAEVIGTATALNLLFGIPPRGGGSRVGRGHSRLRPDHRDRHQSRHALHRARHPWRHGDAAQPLSALGRGSDAPVRREPRRPARGGQARDHRFAHPP